MNLYGFTPAQIDHAVAVCNAGFYAGLMEFQQTWAREPKRTGRWHICGVIRSLSSDAPGARRTASGRRSRSYDWQGHYDFMEQLLLQNDQGRIRSGLYGECDYIGLLGFYLTCGKVKGRVVSSPWAGNGYQTTTFGDLEGNGREAA